MRTPAVNTGSQGWLALAIFVAVLLCGMASPLRAQEADREAERERNVALYYEAIDPILLSANVEGRPTPNVRIRFGVGTHPLGILPRFSEVILGSRYRLLALPMTASYVNGGRLKYEVGGGAVLGYSREGSRRREAFASLVGVAGVRYEHPWGAMVRVAFTPMLSLNRGEAAYPQRGFSASYGISVGYAF